MTTPERPRLRVLLQDELGPEAIDLLATVPPRERRLWVLELLPLGRLLELETRAAERLDERTDL